MLDRAAMNRLDQCFVGDVDDEVPGHCDVARIALQLPAPAHHADPDQRRLRREIGEGAEGARLTTPSGDGLATRAIGQGTISPINSPQISSLESQTASASKMIHNMKYKIRM